MVGTVVSGGFLVLIGLLNLVILIDIVRVYRRLKSGEYDAASLELDLTAGGFMSRIFGRLFRVIRYSWQMYPIGFPLASASTPHRRSRSSPSRLGRRPKACPSWRSSRCR